MKNMVRNWNPKQIVFLTVNSILVIAFILVSICAKNGVRNLYSQQEAQRWENEENSYAQVSAFIAPEKGMGSSDVSNIRSSLMETLSRDSLNETSGNGRVWIDAYSGECKAEVRKDNNTLSVTAMGVGGDFFQFHPMRLLSGSYISDEDLNQDRIVIDEGLAWAMFGSNNVVGMQVWMGNSIYVVAGVVAVEKDSLHKMAYGKGNRIYMSYDQLKQQQENLRVTCYEAVLPNPITNYAYNALSSACGLSEEEEEALQQEENPLNFDQIEVVENSNRYETWTMLTNMKHLKLRSMRTNSVSYPYWENVARVNEEEQMVLLVIRIILLIVPFVSLVVLFYHLWTHKSWTVKGIVLWMIEKICEKRALEEKESGVEEDEPEGDDYADEDNQGMEEETEEFVGDAEEEDAESQDTEEPDLIVVTTENIFDMKEKW